ncbi:MAG: hypothetical protein WCK63_08865 [Betaproteobacteria bacterium]
MNRLIAELQRLYFLHDQQWHLLETDNADGFGALAECIITDEIVACSLAGELNAAIDLVGADGQVRAMVVDFSRATDWEQVARLFNEIQEHLELPAPAISVSAKAGYQLWLSLAESVPAAQAEAFLNELCLKYLREIPRSQLRHLPQSNEPVSADGRLLPLAPALDRRTGKWSAFIDPTMGSMFTEAPGLEMAPNLDRQADILSRLKCIKAEEFQRALSRLQTEASASPTEPAPVKLSPDSPNTCSTLSIGNDFSDPKSFLLAVMNDPSATTGQRINAAKALLPYFEITRP